MIKFSQIVLVQWAITLISLFIPTSLYAEVSFLVQIMPQGKTSIYEKLDEAFNKLGPKAETGYKYIELLDDDCTKEIGKPWILIKIDDKYEKDFETILYGIKDSGGSRLFEFYQKPSDVATEGGPTFCIYTAPIEEPSHEASVNPESRIKSHCEDGKKPAHTPADHGSSEKGDPLTNRTCHAQVNDDEIRGFYRDAGKDVIVGILDTGLAIDHPDFANSVLPGKDIITNSNDPYEGMSKNWWNSENRGHGTHIAGIIAANLDHKGIQGIAPEAEILPVRMLDENVRGNILQARRAVCYAINQGVNIINASWAFCGDNAHKGGEQYFKEAMELANKKGVLIVAAYGPNSGNNPMKFYPADYAADDSFNNVISVATTKHSYTNSSKVCKIHGDNNSNDETIELSRLSHRCAETGPKCTQPQIAAPGGGTFSTVIPIGKGERCIYESYIRDISRDGETIISKWRGNSFATPYVTGAAAAYWSRCITRGSEGIKHPKAEEVKQAIVKASRLTPVDGVQYGFLDLKKLAKCKCPDANGNVDCDG